MVRVASYQTLYRTLLILSLSFGASAAVAQDQPKDEPQDPKASAQPAQDSSAGKQAQPADAVDPLKRPANDKQRKKNARALKQELSKPYKKWLDEDVAY